MLLVSYCWNVALLQVQNCLLNGKMDRPLEFKSIGTGHYTLKNNKDFVSKIKNCGERFQSKFWKSNKSNSQEYENSNERKRHLYHWRVSKKSCEFHPSRGLCYELTAYHNYNMFSLNWSVNCNQNDRFTLFWNYVLFGPSRRSIMQWDSKKNRPFIE